MNLYLIGKTISLSFGISGMILITLAIASPNGITFSEPRAAVRAIEIIASSFSIGFAVVLLFLECWIPFLVWFSRRLRS